MMQGILVRYPKNVLSSLSDLWLIGWLMAYSNGLIKYSIFHELVYSYRQTFKKVNFSFGLCTMVITFMSAMLVGMYI